MFLTLHSPNKGTLPSIFSVTQMTQQIFEILYSNLSWEHSFSFACQTFFWISPPTWPSWLMCNELTILSRIRKPLFALCQIMSYACACDNAKLFKRESMVWITTTKLSTLLDMSEHQTVVTECCYSCVFTRGSELMQGIILILSCCSLSERYCSCQHK